jgi:hypothetical protein
MNINLLLLNSQYVFMDAVDDLLDPQKQGINLIKTSFELAKNTFDSWKEVWNEAIFNADATLWKALVSASLTITGLCLIWLLFTEGKEAINKQDWGSMTSMLVWPIIIAILLGGNGYLLANSVKVLRGVGLNTIAFVQQVQIGEYKAKDALENLAVSQAGRAQIQSAIRECDGKQGIDKQECFKRAIVTIDSVVEQAESSWSGSIIGDFSDKVKALKNAIARAIDAGGEVLEGDIAAAADAIAGIVLRDSAMGIVTIILNAVQWAFVNILEASLLLHCVLAPMAIAMSILPLQTRPIVAWITGLISLFGIQLCYNIIVGIVALVIVKTDGSFAGDLGFAFMLAVFAPTISVALAAGGGNAIYENVNSATSKIANTVTTVTFQTVSYALGKFA